MFTYVVHQTSGQCELYPHTALRTADWKAARTGRQECLPDAKTAGPTHAGPAGENGCGRQTAATGHHFTSRKNFRPLAGVIMTILVVPLSTGAGSTGSQLVVLMWLF